ncbi:hypothetical protein VPHK391_0078 [Vibrio phage K391]
MSKVWRYGTPVVPVGETLECFVAVKWETNYTEKKTHQKVMQLQFCNRPLLLDEHEEVIQHDWNHVTEDGEPIEAIGWHHCREHQDFDGYYTPIYPNWEIVAYQRITVPEFPTTTENH